METVQAVSFQAVYNTETQLAMERSLVLIFALHGRSTVREVHRETALQPAGLYAVNPLTFYQIVCPPGAGVLCLRISPELLHMAGWTDELTLDCRLPDGASNDALHVDLRRRYARLFRAFFQDGDAAEPASEAIELAALLRRQFAAAGASRAAGSAETLGRMEQIVRTLQTRWREPLSLAALAAEHFLSESYLSRLFRSCLGMTFTAYLLSIRLEHAAADLRTGGRSVTETAYGNGFKSVNAFISYFRQRYGVTPGQYRREAEDGRQPPHADTIAGDPADWLQTLLQYADAPRRQASADAAQHRRIQVDAARAGQPLRPSWRRLVNIGYARDGLTGAVQEQLRRAKNEIGFTDLRFHGIFDDDMHIYQQNADGSPWFNFTYADLLFDFILSVGLTPYVELGFVPSKLAREPYRMFERCSMACMYSDQSRWQALVQAVIAHWIERYGLDQVVSWRFTIQSFNYTQLADIPFFYEDYCEMFEVTYRTLKALDPRLRLGGPGGFTSVTLAPDGARRFLTDMQARGCPPDFLTAQCYPHENIVQDSEFMDFTASQVSTPSVLSKDEDFIAHFLRDFHALADELGLGGRELVLEECNSTLWQRDLSGDTCYKAAWLTKNMLENCNEADMIGYWLLTDFIEEWLAPGGVFHGGYGLFTAGGIPKAGYQALRLLNHAGAEQIAAGEGWFVSRSGGEIQLFLYHYCHYDALYRYRYQKLRNPFDAYKVFQPRGELRLTVELTGLPPGDYRQEKRAIGRAAGSSYDKWLEIGAPSSLRPDDLRYISETAQPSYEVCDCHTAGTLTVEAVLRPHEVHLIRLKRRDF
ncbi:MAG: helix-turn-helix domain-containing protein [Eubacteriales bacterium]|nr:helix-turn-helix domain-containing protein [Eubacteriales bacterium]